MTSVHFCSKSKYAKTSQHFSNVIKQCLFRNKEKLQPPPHPAASYRIFMVRAKACSWCKLSQCDRVALLPNNFLIKGDIMMKVALVSTQDIKPSLDLDLFLSR